MLLQFLFYQPLMSLNALVHSLAQLFFVSKVCSHIKPGN